MVKTLILILASLIILLCLLQEDKSEGILSLNVKSHSSKNEKVKFEKYLNIVTVVLVSLLFICLFIEMI